MTEVKPKTSGGGAASLLNTLSSRVNVSSSSTSTSEASFGCTLVCCFIYDTTLKPATPSPSEDALQDAKLVYYYPSYRAAEEKRAYVGIIEGLVAFTGMFSGSSKPLRSIHSKQHVFVVNQCEQNIWMTLVFRNPQVVSMKGSSVAEVAWKEEVTSESVYLAVLKNLYAVFRLLHGKIRTFLDNLEWNELTDLLDDFVPAYLESIDGDSLSFFHEIDGFYYGPVERSTFMSVERFKMRLHEKYDFIKYMSLLYDGCLVYNGLPFEDMRVLYSYLVCYNDTINPLKLCNFPFGRLPTTAAQPGGGSSSFGRANLLIGEDGYLLGPKRDSMFLPSIYFYDNSEGRLLVLVHKKLMLILIIYPEIAEKLDEMAFEELRESAVSIPGGLRDLLRPISFQVDRSVSKPDSYRFYYYNDVNKAIYVSNKCPPGVDQKKGKSCLTHSETHTVQEMQSLFSDLSSDSQHITKVSLKHAKSGWIKAATSLERKYFLLLDDQKASFDEANDEAAHFASVHLTNIFMN